MISEARKLATEKIVVAEVKNLEKLLLALKYRANIARRDNFNHRTINKVLKVKPENAKFAISENIETHNADPFQIARSSGFISSDALTKHSRAIDLLMQVTR